MLLSLPLSAQLGLALFATEVALTLTRRARARGDARRDDRTLRTLWLTIALTMVATTQVVGATPALGVALAPWGAALAAAVFAAGLALRWSAVVTLGRLFTVDVAIRDGHGLVTRGPFAVVRHPAYAGLLLAFAGVALAFAHLLAPVLVLAPIALAVRRRVRVEERALADAFGAEWTAYAGRTPALVPRPFSRPPSPPASHPAPAVTPRHA